MIKKIITTFFVSVIFLFISAGVSSAQFSETSVDTTNTNTNTDETSISSTNNGVDLNEEIGTIEESIGRTENALDNIDSTIKTKATDSEDLNNTKNDSKTDRPGDSFQDQSRELLKILKEKNIPRIEGLKKEKIRDTKQFLEEEKKKDISTEDKDKNDTSEDKDNTDVNEQEKKTELDSADTEKIAQKEIEAERITTEKKDKIIKRVKVRKAKLEAMRDSDGDGISNYDEVNIYGTDPTSADSDGDGYSDGTEVLRGFNPKDNSRDAIVVYQNPKVSGDVENGLFAVSKIKVVKTSVKNEKQANGNNVSGQSESSSRVEFRGRSLPNSFITLYIFSIPTVVTVKTDRDGNWNYVMDRELENGKHEIYVAMTDNSGKILAKSSPIPFVKEALAVTVDNNLLSSQVDGSMPSFFSVGYLYVTVLALIFFSGIILITIGIKINFGKGRVDDVV